MIHYGRTDGGRIAPKNILERLWLKSSGQADDECWEYLGKDVTKAGHVRIRKNTVERIFVHRLAWEAYNAEPIPDGMYVLHHCDNPKCFNPNHLFIGTIKDNVHDMIKKGRHRPPSKLTKEQRRDIAQSSLDARTLANQYKITPTRIRQIKKGL